jgi:hypothetical protein
VKAPQSLDRDMLTTIEILQHAAEIVSRMPLHAMRAHLAACPMSNPDAPWFEAAHRFVESALLFDLDRGKLSALEARTELTPAPVEVIRPGDIPDDWATR